MKVGYARVSSLIGQETGLDTQVQILKDFGCEKVFSEQRSGTSTKGRDQLRECLDFVREGDWFCFTRIDRVCRNILDLQLIVKELNQKGVILNATEQPISTKDASLPPSVAVKNPLLFSLSKCSLNDVENCLTTKSPL